MGELGEGRHARSTSLKVRPSLQIAKAMAWDEICAYTAVRECDA